MKSLDELAEEYAKYYFIPGFNNAIAQDFKAGYQARDAEVEALKDKIALLEYKPPYELREQLIKAEEALLFYSNCANGDRASDYFTEKDKK